MRRFIEPTEQYLHTTECFLKFSKFMTWILRHGTELLHDSLSLTLHELFHFDEFLRHMHRCRSFINTDPHNIFGDSGTTEIFNECKKHNMLNR